MKNNEQKLYDKYFQLGDIVATLDGDIGEVLSSSCPTLDDEHEIQIYSFRHGCAVSFMTDEVYHIPLRDIDFLMINHCEWYEEENETYLYNDSRTDKPLSPYDLLFTGFRIGCLELTPEYKLQDCPEHLEEFTFKTLSDVCRYHHLFYGENAAILDNNFTEDGFHIKPDLSKIQSMIELIIKSNGKH